MGKLQPNSRKVPLFISGESHVVVSQVWVSWCVNGKCCFLSARLHQPPVAPPLPFRDLAGTCYFVSAWTAAVWILKGSGFKVLEQDRLHSGRVNISWGTSPFGQRRIWQNLRSCTCAPVMSRIKEDGVFSGQRHHVLTLSSMSPCKKG